MPVGKLSQLVTLIPPSGAARRLASVALVDAVGTGFFLAGSAVFFVRVLGLSAAQVGLALGISSLVGFLTTVPMGMLADRLGPKRMLVGLHLWRAAWMAMLPLCTNVLTFGMVASLLAVADTALTPLTRTLVSDVMGPADRTRTLGFMRSWRNAGFAIGAACTTPLIALNDTRAYTAVVLLNAVSYAVAAWVVARLPIPRADPAPSAAPAAAPKAAPEAAPEAAPATAAASAPTTSRRHVPTALLDRPYVALTLLDAVLMTHITLLTVGIPLWVVDVAHLPATVVPALMVTNTVLAVALQVRFASGGESSAVGRRSLRRAGFCLSVCCLLVAATWHAPTAVAIGLLVAAVLALTAGELWQAAGSWALSYRFAPPEQEAEYLSVFSLGSTAQSVVAPIVLTSLVLGAGSVGWLVCAAAFAGLTVAVAPVVGRLERQRRTLSGSPVSAEGAPVHVPLGSPTVDA